MIPVDEALDLLLGGIERLDVETVPLVSAGHRVLAGPIVAGRTHPPFDASAMDGYAVRATDVEAVPARLAVIGESAAGRRFSGTVGAGDAVRIFTGAPVPQGADTILIQENAEREGDVITATETVAVGRHIRRAGLDFHEGDVLLEAGRRVDPQALALIAAADATSVTVVRRPRVAIIATGDELVQLGAPRTDDQIIASNSFGVAQMVRDAGGEAIDLGIVRDDEAAIAAALDSAVAKHSDVIVTLGGASVGDHDLTAKAFVANGVDLAFWKIAMRPGKPLMAGRLGAISVLGLPGNPVSSMVCAELFLRPLLAVLQGQPQRPRLFRAVLDGNLGANDRRQDYVRAIVRLEDDGELVATPLDVQDSSMLGMLARANCLIVREPLAAPQSIGDPCRVLLLRPIG